MKRFYLETQIWGVIVLVMGINLFVIDSIYLFNPRKYALYDVYNYCNSDEEAVIKATTDFNNNKLRVMIFGMLEKEGERDNRIISMEKTYGFTFISTGCMTPDYVRTYDQVMKHLINDKYKTMLFRTTDIYTVNYFKQKKPLPPYYL